MTSYETNLINIDKYSNILFGFVLFKDIPHMYNHIVSLFLGSKFSLYGFHWWKEVLRTTSIFMFALCTNFRFLCECTLVLLRVAYILPLYMMLANFPISRPVNV